MRRNTILAAALSALALVFSAPATAAQTVVSLNFDDGTADQNAARSILAPRGMIATFYISTGKIGASGFLSWSELAALNADGHEIAGHTLDHVDLTAVDSAEARRQVCDDRTNLTARGFIARSFAYPYGEYDSAVETIVQECGYASGRAAFGLRNITAPNDSRPYAGSIPPPDPYAVLTPCCIDSATPLSALQNYITQAENNGGGWVPLVLHRVCDGCGEPSISPATLAALLDWLQPRASHGTVVRTVSQVISGDAAPPTSSIACNLAVCSGWYDSPVSVTLSAADGGSGVEAIRYTLDGSEPTTSSTLYSGAFTVSATTTVKYRAWDSAGNAEAAKSQVVPVDTQPPTVAIVSPANGSTVKGNVKIWAEGTDAPSGIVQVRFYANGILLGTKTSAPYSVSWQTNKLARGQHTLTAVAEDAAGNTTTSASVVVTVK